MFTMPISLANVIYFGLCFLGWLLASSSALRKIVSILQTPTENIGALPTEGLVEITGSAGGQTIQSPISRSACVFWQVVIQEKRSSGKGSHWATIYKKLSDGAFEVSDMTGRVQVLADPKSELILNSDVHSASNFYNFDAGLQSTLEGLGINTTGFLGFNRTLRVFEMYIQTGEQIYVHGYVNYDNGVKQIASGNGMALIISDQSEKSVLTKLYWRVAIAGGFTVFLGFMFRSIGVGILSQFL
jgi:hypothetical protein